MRRRIKPREPLSVTMTRSSDNEWAIEINGQKAGHRARSAEGWRTVLSRWRLYSNSASSRIEEAQKWFAQTFECDVKMVERI